MAQRPLAMLGAVALAAAAALALGVAHTQAALGPLLSYAPTPTGSTPRPTEVSGVRDLAVSGALAFVVDAGNGRIAVFNATTGAFVRQIGTKGTGQGQLQLPVSVALATDTGLKQQLVVVSDYNGSKIVEFRAVDGAFVREFGVRGSKLGELDQPSALTVDAAGTVYVADFGNDRIQSFSLAGAALAELKVPDGAGGYGHVSDLATDNAGTLWATFTTQGTTGFLQLNAANRQPLQKTLVKTGTGIGQVSSGIGGIAVVRDVGTGKRTIYATDPNGYRVLRFVAGPNATDVPVAVDSWPTKGDEAFRYKPERVRPAGALFHVIGVVPAYAVSVWGTVVPKPVTAASWVGTWITDFGTLKVTVRGERATGTYTYDSGRITATVSGRTLTGKWSESPTYAGPRDAGTFRLKLSADAKSFTGTWSYSDGTTGSKPYWNGRR